MQGYDAAQLLGIGLDAVRGDVSAEKELTRAMRGARVDSPRGAFTLSPSHNPVQNIYLREAQVGREPRGRHRGGSAGRPWHRLPDGLTRAPAPRTPR